jgi:hypothetical protein
MPVSLESNSVSRHRQYHEADVVAHKCVIQESIAVVERVMLTDCLLLDEH